MRIQESPENDNYNSTTKEKCKYEKITRSTVNIVWTLLIQTLVFQVDTLFFLLLFYGRFLHIYFSLNFDVINLLFILFHLTIVYVLIAFTSGWRIYQYVVCRQTCAELF